MASGHNIEIELKGACAWLTFTRADKLNPLDWATVRELKAAVAAIEAKPEVMAVIITGRGRSFSAGGDLDGYIGLYQNPDKFAAFLNDFLQALKAIEASSKIYLAAVNGVCVAGGLELLLACDLAIAAESAKIGDGHLNFGQLPGAGGSQRLPRAVGLLRAKHLMLTGDLVSAAEAKQIGLVNEVVPDTQLLAAAEALVTRLGEKSRVGLRGAKYLANLTLTADLDSGLRQEIEFVLRYATTEHDATEGLVAFKEKRKPVFSR
ncbi:MAG: enoyl-CoA hydratase/isomerase family protein [Pseudolabrys sp.]|nr:enoyl-CoA hydratase/isomerase family protein [Pseudolabrys sp.]MDP2297184.1 enoyl-CoA hydratase/isomerase family protein [Pseudolabrys sp.]